MSVLLLTAGSTGSLLLTLGLAARVSKAKENEYVSVCVGLKIHTLHVCPSPNRRQHPFSATS